MAIVLPTSSNEDRMEPTQDTLFRHRPYVPSQQNRRWESFDAEFSQFAQ